MTAEEIKLLPTEALLKELSERHDAMVFSAIKFTNQNSPDYICVRRWTGMPFVCQGLLSLLNSCISLHILKIEQRHAV